MGKQLGFAFSLAVSLNASLSASLRETMFRVCVLSELSLCLSL